MGTVRPVTLCIFGGIENKFDLFQFEISLKVILSALGQC